MVRPAIIQGLKSKISGDAFALCAGCGNVPDWDGRGDFHWVSCRCGARTGQHLDPPDAKTEWNATNSNSKEGD